MDLMDEMEASDYGRDNPEGPTNAIPGSLEKVIVMQRRCEAGLVDSGRGVFCDADTQILAIESCGTEVTVEAPLKHFPYVGAGDVVTRKPRKGEV